MTPAFASSHDDEDEEHQGLSDFVKGLKTGNAGLLDAFDQKEDDDDDV